VACTLPSTLLLSASTLRSVTMVLLPDNAMLSAQCLSRITKPCLCFAAALLPCLLEVLAICTLPSPRRHLRQVLLQSPQGCALHAVSRILGQHGPHLLQPAVAVEQTMAPFHSFVAIWIGCRLKQSEKAQLYAESFQHCWV
jgi:hypothetical protein